MDSKEICLYCGGTLFRFLEGVFDTRFGIDRYFNICQCNLCTLIQLSPYPSDDELKQLYEAYYNFGGSKKGLYTKLRKKILESISYRLWMAIDGDICFHSRRGSGRLLDVGCNEGRGLNIYKQNGFIAEGLELNEQAADEARKKGFRVFTDSLENIQSEQKYDVVVLSHVLEHSLEPKEMLSNIARVLKTGGQAWISCPNIDSWQRKVFGRYWINWHVPFHIAHFCESNLTNILQETGFEIQAMRQETPALWFVHSIIARLFAKPGRPTIELRNLFLVGFLMLLVRFVFFPLLWIGNQLGRGDCLVVIAREK